MSVFKAYHNSHDLFYREPFGAVTCGQEITFRLSTFSDEPVESCVLRLWAADGEITLPLHQTSEKRSVTSAGKSSLEPFEEGMLFEENYKVPDTPGLIWYYFIIREEAKTYYYGNNLQKLGGEGMLCEQEPPSYQITVHKQVLVPEWYKHGVMYQIFVDRFYNDRPNGFSSYPRKNALLHANWSDLPIYIKDEAGRVTDWDFFGGTLGGVIRKLPYLKQLGISILYFNPIFDAPSNHKYDTADYRQIDPMYGDEGIFKLLIDTARPLGISVILDGVFSHTGSDSVYFNRYGNFPGIGAYQSTDSPYYSWYKFKNDHQGYESWWGVDTLPEVNEMNTTYKQFIFGLEDSVISKWLNLGVAGWRLDVADELPDEFIQELRQAIKSLRPNAVLIGEVWEDASNKVSFSKQRQYFLGDELDSTMNYPFRASFLSFMLGQSDSSVVHDEIMSLYENYPRENFYAAMNLIGSHDTIRILTLLGDAPAEKGLTRTEQRSFRLPQKARQLAVQRLKLLSLVQMTFPGVPCIYYGDEAGVEGYADPYNRGTYPWGQEDQEIMAWYRRILNLHSEYEVLQTGDFKSFCFTPDVYGFTREGDEEAITLLINRCSEETKTVNLKGILQSSPFVIDLITGERLAPKMFSALPINPLGAKALLTKKKPPHNLDLTRSCGVLLHISSLPSTWGLGDLGKEAYEFVDLLAEAGQSLWQVLPLNPAGVGECPYQSESVFAGNTGLISLDHMIEEKLLSVDETRGRTQKVSSTGLRKSLLFLAYKELKSDLLYEAYQKFLELLEIKPLSSADSLQSSFVSKENFLKFKSQNQDWLKDYGLFRALKAHFKEVPWYEWESKLAAREEDEISQYRELLQDKIGFIEFLQYAFFHEWNQLKTYAKSKGVQLIGDLPHFAAADSCDVWVNRDLFVLDGQGRPAKTAGVPPDYFSKTGQLWGNPVYDWEALAVTQYGWWKKRIKLGLEMFDTIRLDHFRGFETYWEVNAGEETAEKGRWAKGPGKKFFESMFNTFGIGSFILEDLGEITPEVNVLTQILGYPGMKVLQFTPLAEIERNDETNFVYYSGTHDNNTLLGWYEKNLQEVENTVDAASQKVSSRAACRRLIEEAYMGQAVWVILPVQDILGLGEEARMNVPGTIYGNWQWRLDQKLVTDEIKLWLRSLAERAKRLKIEGTEA